MKIYKYIFILLLFSFGSSIQIQAQSSNLMKILDNLEDRDGVTSILVTKKMFELFTKTTDIDIKGESINEVLGKLDKLMIYEVNLTSNEQKSITSNITSTLNVDGYEILMKINEKDENVEIYILEKDDIVRHLFLISKSKSDLHIISLVGNIDLEQISKLSGTLNIDELQHIKKK